MIDVKVQEEVLEFLRALPPHPKKALREGIRNLSREAGDIVPLTDKLEGYHRLRVGSYRVIFRYQVENKKRCIVCVYAAPRKWVYEVFHSRLADGG